MKKPMRGPVMIVGIPRSGTSLLTAILNNHPDVYIAPESHFFFYLWGSRRILGQTITPTTFNKLESYFSSLKNIGSGWMKTDISTETLKENFFSQPDLSYEKLFDLFLEMLAGQVGKQLYGEKTPLHLYFLPTIYSSYKDASIIHVVRDGRAVVCSLLSTGWGGNHIDYSLFWKNGIRLGERYSNLSSEQYLQVKYEDLLSQPENQLHTICNYLKIDFSDNLLNFNYTNTAFGDSKQNYRGGFDRQALSRWQTKLSKESIAHIEYLIAGELRTLKYTPRIKNNGELSLLQTTRLKAATQFYPVKNAVLRYAANNGILSLLQQNYSLPIKKRVL